MDIQEIAQIIRQRREILQVSQAQLAELAGVGIKTIYGIEQAKGNPSLSVLSRLLDTLGLTITIKVKNSPN